MLSNVLYKMFLFAGEGPDSDIVCNGDFPAAPAMGDYKGRCTYMMSASDIKKPYIKGDILRTLAYVVQEVVCIC